ncbi:D-tyrosyl-tRNA(Tyr) deacylase [Saccharospirillum sp. MSK14-1]|uniref:D-aminoacyl-tRNA deacylase n=1 Tax=Saccharospirillum sp. MSK14-1 TaxID=1897632 RepID=UPI000D334A53|nr:D-aminoacyl-tRNA deacylase [Saccharospirillum sp. MSK14-1]PTY37564.1 D-tyrosyl-tRNA(Tyr) deacylase [Saccharospirillum sp. MSK14-1]
MKALIQRVRHARVEVDGDSITAINQGMLVLVGIDKGDEIDRVEKMAHKLLNYRIFADADDRMNLNVQESEGALLLVSQFTLSADTHKGLRPSFTSAAPPADGERIFNALVAEVRRQYDRVQTGRFGANMQIELLNDGPVTFLLEVN